MAELLSFCKVGLVYQGTDLENVMKDYNDKLILSGLSSLTYLPNEVLSCNVVKGKKEYKSKKNTQISIISINEGNKITTGGLKYNLKDEVLKSRSHGISNSTIEDNFFIECVKPILLFRKL